MLGLILRSVGEILHAQELYTDGAVRAKPEKDYKERCHCWEQANSDETLILRHNDGTHSRRASDLQYERAASSRRRVK